MGVTKFSQVSVFSGFNQPNDISMAPQFETLCGITQQELEYYFAEPIHQLAEDALCTDEEMRGILKQRYDGYHFSKKMVDVYNPFSLLNAFKNVDVKDYWFSSGTPTYLIRLLQHTQDGYLTIKGYNRDFGTFLLDYPNNEVKSGFVSLVAASYLKPQENLNSWVRSVVISLRKGEPEQLRKLFTSFLASIPYTMRSKKDETEKERYFHYTLYLIFRLISVYTVYTEKEQSQGRADYIVETPYYVYVFEFKRDGSADEALAQIEEKGYARPYESDKRRLYKIGVNFSSETGTVEEWKCLNIG